MCNLILRLYEMRREDRLREARKWFTGSFKVKTFEEFQALCPPGSEPNASYRMVITYWEMVASFLTSGVLNAELFYQSGRELLLVWERVRDIVPAMRETLQASARAEEPRRGRAPRTSRGGITRRRARTTPSPNEYEGKMQKDAWPNASRHHRMGRAACHRRRRPRRRSRRRHHRVRSGTRARARPAGTGPPSSATRWSATSCRRRSSKQLLGKSGIDNKTTIVLYGDNNNWFAAWAFWQLKVYGHDDVRIMDGGRKKWLAEGRDLSTEKPSFTATTYKAGAPDLSLRAFLPEVQQAVAGKKAALVDVRSPQEFTGEILAPPGLPETCQRGGHIPGAKSIPWGKNCNDDGTFKSFDELKALYAEKGITGDQPVIAYCRIGERSSLTWFAMKYLLGFDNVKNYDGSWTEWGNLVGAPVEKP